MEGLDMEKGKMSSEILVGMNQPSYGLIAGLMIDESLLS